MPDTMMSQEQRPPENHSMEVAKLAAALAMAQKNFAPIPKDREVTVQSDRGKYKFKYATLDAIRSATMPALAEQTLAIVQGMVEYGNGYAVETKLIHSSGEWIRNVTPMFVSGRVKDGRQLPPTNQELGSAQSYARRYGISALLCITADEDDDGNTADGNHIEDGSRAPYTPYKPGVGSASAGTDFRPARRGSMMSAATDSIKDARRDIEAQNGPQERQQSKTPTPAPAPGKKSAAEKAKTWTDNAIQTIRLPGQHVGSLDKRWKDQQVVPAGAKFSPLGWLEEAAPEEYERLQAAFDEVRSNAQQVAA